MLFRNFHILNKWKPQAWFRTWRTNLGFLFNNIIDFEVCPIPEMFLLIVILIWVSIMFWQIYLNFYSLLIGICLKAFMNFGFLNQFCLPNWHKLSLLKQGGWPFVLHISHWLWGAPAYPMYLSSPGYLTHWKKWLLWAEDLSPDKGLL